MTPLDDERANLRFEIAASRRILYRHGCDSWIGGHVTARAPEGGFWATPLQYLDETEPTDLIRLSYDLEVLEGDHPSSPALAFHAAIYQARPDVESIVHTHSDSVAALSTTDQVLGMYNQVAAFFYGDVVRQDLDANTDESYGGVFAKALGSKKVLLMPNHGSIVVSDSVPHAAIEAIMLERAAKFHIAAQLLGGVEYPLSETLRLKKNLYSFFREEMWASNLRRLAVAEPDFFASFGAATRSRS